MHHWFAARWSESHLEPIAEPRPVAESLELLDFTYSVDAEVLHVAVVGREGFFSERLLTRNHEHDVIRHQVEHRREITRFAGGEPGFHQVANCLFVVLHGFGARGYGARFDFVARSMSRPTR